MVEFRKTSWIKMRKLIRKIKQSIKDFLALKRQNLVLPKFLKNAKGKKILLISHQLTTTGSPLALYYLAKELVKNGFSPMVLSYKGGDLISAYKKIGVEVICGEIYNNNPEALKNVASNFDKIIANSILCYGVVDLYKDAIWWIHEGQNIELSFMVDYPKLESVLRKAENVFVVSDYAKQVVDKYNPNSKIIMLGVPDAYKPTAQSDRNDKIKFANVGNICECKAQDVLLEAILKLDSKYLEQCEFHFFCEKKGRRYRKMAKASSGLNNIFFEGLISNQDVKWENFSQMDVFIIPSRDESCSLVAIEACMLKKPIIVSENVGAKYMVKDKNLLDEGNGYVFPTNDSEKLKEAIEKLIINKDNLVKLGEVSRMMYEKFASFENHINELNQIIDLCRD